MTRLYPRGALARAVVLGLLACTCLWLSSAPAAAQLPAGTQPASTTFARKACPCIHSDLRVTFVVRAPGRSRYRWSCRQALRLVRDTSGTWTVTTNRRCPGSTTTRSCRRRRGGRPGQPVVLRHGPDVKRHRDTRSWRRLRCDSRRAARQHPRGALLLEVHRQLASRERLRAARLRWRTARVGTRCSTSSTAAARMKAAGPCRAHGPESWTT